VNGIGQVIVGKDSDQGDRFRDGLVEIVLKSLWQFETNRTDAEDAEDV
jgi:hypothetical protein